MRTFTRQNVEQLINDFGQMEHLISSVQKQLNREIRRYLDSPDPIDPRTFKQVTACASNCNQVLSQYTTGLLRYARSVAKAKEEDRPEETFLNTVRETRLKAEQIQADFNWILDYWNQQILLHNLAVGDLSAACPAGGIQPDPVGEDSPVPVNGPEEDPRPSGDSALAMEPAPAP